VRASHGLIEAGRRGRRRAEVGPLVLAVLSSLGHCRLARCGWETGNSKSLSGYYYGTQEWIHGWGKAGEPMRFCPSKCTPNSDYATHETATQGYAKQWDKTGWQEPKYGAPSHEEIKSGFSAPIQGYVQAGEATLCKKPYAVCDYPNGDVFVRHALQEIQVRITEKQCLSSMKHFLCTLYRRRCYQNTDGDANSVTYGNQGIKPVCFEQCMNAYLDCKYDRRHANLMCGEYIKAGWVSFKLTEMQSDQCDSPAAPVARPLLWLILTATSLLSLVLALMQ